MAKQTIEERRLKLLAELAKLREEEKAEKGERLAKEKAEKAVRRDKLGELTENFLMGKLGFNEFISNAEIISELKFTFDEDIDKTFSEALGIENPTPSQNSKQ